MVEIDGARRPFWMHQVVEYLIGLVLLAAAFQSPTPTVPAVMGVVVLVNAAVAIGPAGGFRWVPRRVHRWIDLVVTGALAFLAVQPWSDIEVTGRLILGAIAFVLFFIWLNTDFETRPERRNRGTGASRPTSTDIGRHAGRAVGGGVNAMKRWREQLGGGSDDEPSARGDS